MRVQHSRLPGIPSATSSPTPVTTKRRATTANVTEAALKSTALAKTRSDDVIGVKLWDRNVSVAVIDDKAPIDGRKRPEVSGSRVCCSAAVA